MLELMERSKSGQRIEQRREQLRIPQAELARTLGVKRASVWGWEKEGKIPRQDVLLRLSEVLKTSTAYLLGETDDPSPLPRSGAPAPPEEERKAPASQQEPLLSVILSEVLRLHARLDAAGVPKVGESPAAEARRLGPIAAAMAGQHQAPATNVDALAQATEDAS